MPVPEAIVSPIRQGAHDIAVSREKVRRRRVFRVGIPVVLLEAYIVFSALTGRRILPGDAVARPDGRGAGPVLRRPDRCPGAHAGGHGRGRRTSPSGPSRWTSAWTTSSASTRSRRTCVRSIDLFQTHRQFAEQMGGTPRRGLLFEGLPGTGKTMTAKAMAAEAGVPFLFVSATSFQSMYYGATAKKIRAYFKALRKAARAEGGAIGFIEEIDAIAMARGGMAMTASFAASPFDVVRRPRTVTNAVVSEGTGGVVNELLVQMQSFDEPTGGDKFVNWFIARANLLMPASRQMKQRKPTKAPILLIAATNRADNLDPALLRPGRFDRRLTFSPPDAHGRRALVDHFLATRSTDVELEDADAARPAGRRHERLDAGDDRAPARRGAGQRAAPRVDDDDLRRRRARPHHGDGRHRAARRLHAGRAGAHRHARGRPRRDRLARRPEPHARGADDHPARRRARPARAQRLRRGLDALALRPAGARADRDGRLGRRGALLRADEHRPRRRPRRRDPHRRPDGRRRGHDGLPDLVRRDPARPGVRRPRATRPPASSSKGCSTTRAAPSAGCCPSTVTWSRRCATRSSSGTSCSAPRSPTCSRRPRCARSSWPSRSRPTTAQPSPRGPLPPWQPPPSVCASPEGRPAPGSVDRATVA